MLNSPTSQAKLCYVSMNYLRELATTRRPNNPMVREFVLPNGSTRLRGFVKAVGAPAASEDEQCLTMGNERISVPEVMFNPSDIGLEQAGLAEAIVQAVNEAHPMLRGAMYGNVVLTGGSSQFPNFRERVQKELRELAPAELPVRVTSAANPITAAWHGASQFAQSKEYEGNTVTLAEYKERGSTACQHRFAATGIAPAQ